MHCSKCTIITVSVLLLAYAMPKIAHWERSNVIAARVSTPKSRTHADYIPLLEEAMPDNQFLKTVRHLHNTMSSKGRARTRISDRVGRPIPGWAHTAFTSSSYRDNANSLSDAYKLMQQDVHASMPASDAPESPSWTDCPAGTRPIPDRESVTCKTIPHASKHIMRWADNSVDPCKNFYSHVCNNFRQTDQPLFRQVAASNTNLLQRMIGRDIDADQCKTRACTFNDACKASAMESNWGDGSVDTSRTMVGQIMRSAVDSIVDGPSLSHSMGRMAVLGVAIPFTADIEPLRNDTSRFAIYITRDRTKRVRSWTQISTNALIGLRFMGVSPEESTEIIKNAGRVNEKLRDVMSMNQLTITQVNPFLLAKTSEWQECSAYLFDESKFTTGFSPVEFSQGLWSESGAEPPPSPADIPMVVRTFQYINAVFGVTTDFAKWRAYYMVMSADALLTRYLPTSAPKPTAVKQAANFYETQSAYIDRMSSTVSRLTYGNAEMITTLQPRALCYELTVAFFADQQMSKFDDLVKNTNEIDSMIETIRNSLISMVEESELIPQSAVDVAVPKLRNIIVKYLYRHQYGNAVDSLQGVVVGHMHAENVLNMLRHRVERLLSVFAFMDHRDKTREIARRSNQGYVDPAVFVAQYHVIDNSVVISPGAFQHPFFGISEARNYGYLGAGIAHEMAHSIIGQYIGADEYGSLVSSHARNAAARSMSDIYMCVSRQFGGTQLSQGGQLDDQSIERTLVENVADTMGMNAALRAFLQVERTAEQMDEFFTSYASFWCSRSRGVNKKDSHTPDEMRVTGTLQHTSEFSSHYKCKPSTRCV